ncbi:MAG: hypothetical protein ABIP94_01425, partial [Planctomycetota bacterium]
LASPASLVAALEPDEATPLERAHVDQPTNATEPTQTAKPPAFDDSPLRVPRWIARFFVVDELEQPVFGATVTIWAARRVLADGFGLRHESGSKYSGYLTAPLTELRTDATGHAQEVFDVERVEVAAAKPGVGWTGRLGLENTRATEMKFVLEPQITLRGFVQRADGSPAAGAKVVVSASGSSIIQQGEPFEPGSLVAGDDGRFTLTVQRGIGYQMYAEQEGVRSFDEIARIHSDDPEVVLVFPGAITLGGSVVDLEGKPVAAAEVSMWREYHIDDPQQAPDWEHVTATTNAQGRFVASVRRHARYQLVAKAPGHANSQLAWAETTAVRSHAEVRLELLASTTIAGRVVRGDGSPFAGVEVGARAETGVPRIYSTVANRIDEFQEVRRVRAGDDGKFELTVHPGTSWTVLAWPDTAASRLCVRHPGIAPGSDDVVLRIEHADLAGCVVRGTVRRADGKPVGDYRVEVITYEHGQPFGGGEVSVRIDGDRFTTSPLSRGWPCDVLVTPVDVSQPTRRWIGEVAAARSKRFTADRAQIELELRLERWGEVPVRVITADGAVAHRVRVEAWRDVRLGYSNSWMPVDAEGKLVLQRCAPGAHRLRVWRDLTVLSVQQLEIAPGPNPEVVVRLPAGVKAR